MIPALPLGAAAFTGGVAAAALLGGPWWASAAIAAAAALAVLARGGERPRAVVLVAAVAMAAAGHARFAEAEARPPPALAAVEGTHRVDGVARGDALVTGKVARVDLSVRAVDGAPAEGGLRLWLMAPREPLRAGDRVSAVVDIERPAEVAEFDYAAYLRARDIHAVAAFPERWEVVERNTGNAAVRALRDLRRWALGNLERSLPEPEAALVAGMLIGERRTMSAELTEDLRITGTSHLVVVSGQNVALLLGTAVGLLTAVMPRRRAALLTLALLPGYVLLVGAEPPVVRAAIMAVGIAVAAASGRRTPGWVYLLYAAALMLAADPLLTRDVAFQLSMSATAGVMLLAPPLRDALLSLGRWTAGGVAAALVEAGATATGAALAVVPVQAAAFERVNLLTVPANVIVAPLYEATLVVGLAGALLGWVPPVAGAVAAAGRFPPALFLGIVGALADLPSTVVPVRAPLAAGAAWYAAFAALTWVLQRREPPALAPAGRRLAATTPLLAVVAGGLWLAALAPGERLASITVLDVGQGLAVLVRDGGSVVLIDTGPPDGAVLRALPRAGARGALDAVVLTHGSVDHSGGLDALRRRYDIGRVFGPPGFAPESLDIGDRIRLSDRTTIEVISPPVATAGRAHVSENDRSLAFLVTVGDRRIVLTADIEASAERWLVASGMDLRADALVVPHHGSRSSSAQPFVDAVDARVAVISVGAENPYGHPHPEVLARYAGALLLRTDENGDVTLRSDGERLWVSTAR